MVQFGKSLTVLHQLLVSSLIALFGCNAPKPPPGVPWDAITWRMVEYVSEPPGARIELNGNYIGITPCQGYVYTTGIGQAPIVINAYSPDPQIPPQSKLLHVPPIPARIYFQLSTGGISQSPSPLYEHTAIDVEFVEEVPQQRSVSSGTGWYVSPNHVCTNHHVVADFEEINVIDEDGMQQSASVISISEQSDLAILKVSSSAVHRPLPIKFDAARVGEEVFTLGYPFPDIMGSELKMASGRISAASGIGGDSSYYQVAVALQHGNSGGPLLDMGGCVVGIISSKLSVAYVLQEKGAIPENVGYAVKTSNLRKLLESIPDVGCSPRPSPASSLPDLVETARGSVVLISAKSTAQAKKRYINRSKEFSIEFPVNWEQQRLEGITAIFKSNKEHAFDVFLENVNIVVARYDLPIDLDRFWEANLLDLRRSGFSIKNTGSTNIAGQECRWLAQDRITGNGIPYIVKQYFLVRGSYGFVITCSAHPDSAAAYEMVFDEIVTSFRFE